MATNEHMFESGFPYFPRLLEYKNLPTTVYLSDHLVVFDKNGHNEVLDYAHSIAEPGTTAWVDYILADKIKSQYPKFLFKFKIFEPVWKSMIDYTIHPEIDYKNFVCSFNGTPHVGRKLLVSILKKFNYYNPNYCSKNFSYSVETIDGHIHDYVDDHDIFYRKFFISDSSDEFFQSINSFGHNQYSHGTNIHTLENKLTESFLHIISETVATSYYPFVTEKFLYSVVTRGLFLAYAQPGWHAHLEKYYGFKPYTKLFDYRFDHIQNPVERLVELMSMISKFSVLSADDWKQMYLLEQDTIEYNYNHYFSQDYLKYLANYS